MEFISSQLDVGIQDNRVWGYGMDNSRFDSWQGFLLLLQKPRAVLKFTHHPIQGVPGVLSVVAVM